MGECFWIETKHSPSPELPMHAGFLLGEVPQPRHDLLVMGMGMQSSPAHRADKAFEGSASSFSPGFNPKLTAAIKAEAQ